MAEEKTLSQVSVRATGDDNKVVLWERHPQHPKPTKTMKVGEVFITNNGKSQIVAETPAVKRLIGEGRLERTRAGEDGTAKNKGGRPKKQDADTDDDKDNLPVV